MLLIYKFLIIIAAIILFAFISIFVPPFFVALNVYKKQLVRTSKEKWGRECSAPDNVEQMKMYELGIKWANENKEYLHEVEITNDNLHLVGHYFDFGYKRSVIILQGRTESLYYSYYFAKPYQNGQYNVLVIDSRAHGLSDGKYNCLGFKEYRDVLKWAKLIHDQYGNEEIILHGICIGGATAMYTLTSKNAPTYIKGLIVDGLYETFYETFKEHMIQDHRPLFPFLEEIMLIMSIHAGKNVKKDGPKYRIKKLEKPILMIHTKLDTFSLPLKAQKMYESCPSKNKQITWFDKGVHSHVRINNEKKYDETIIQFLKNNF